MKRYGINDIFGNKSSVELTKVEVKGNVCAGFVEFTISQLYKNNTKHNVEAAYFFPIPESAIISEFEANIGGRTIKAVVEEKQYVDLIYDKAIQRGENVLSLEKVDAYTFKASLGKIIANEEVSIKVSYIDELQYKDGTLYLMIPAINSPEEVNKLKSKNSIINAIEEKLNGERLNKQESDYDFNFSIMVESLCKIDFRSGTHKIEVERDGEYLSKITLSKDEYCLVKDFELEIEETEHLEADGMIFEYKEEEEPKGIIYLRMIPKIEPIKKLRPENYVFLLDISETMAGVKLEEAKNALQICIRNLEEEDTFNIISAGSKIEHFSATGQVSFNDESLKKASQWIENLKAQGDADIFEALKNCIQGIGSEAGRTIIFFTDDMVENDEEILNYVKGSIGENRIFTFGIDTSANSFFLNKLAQISFGKAEFIYEGERVEDAVLRQFTRIENPQVDDITIDWGKMEVDESYPRTIEYMYDMEPFSVFARYHGEIDSEITLRGNVDGEPYVKKINLDSFELEENANLLQKVWARKRIKSIEEKMRIVRGEVKEAMKNKVIEISKKYNVISPETSYMFIEERDEPVIGIQLRSILPIKTNLEYKNLNGDYDILNPSFMYKLQNDSNEKNKDNDNEYLNRLYPRERLLKIMAKNQFADGSFVDFEDNKFEERVETTAAVLLGFTIGTEDVILYAKQLNKSVDYLLKALDVNGDYLEQKLHYFISAALITSLQKHILKEKTIENVKEKLNWLKENAVNKNYTKVEELLQNTNTKLNLKTLKYIFNLNKENYIEEDIIINNEKESIYNFAKLATLQSFKK